MADFTLLESAKLISRKIWVIEKWWNLHTVKFKLFQNTTEQERADIWKVLENSNIINRLINSTQKVNMDWFEKFVKKAYLHRVKTFPWASVCDSIHNLYAHTIVTMRKIGGFGLGLFRYIVHSSFLKLFVKVILWNSWSFSETRLESSHKILRDLIKNHSRRCCIFHKMVDCLNHMWLKTDPVLRKYKRVPKTRPKKSDATTTSAKNPDDILLESFIIEWNRINWLLKLFVMNFGLNVFENCPISIQNL